MPKKECYHCRQWIDAEEAHDCWTTTEENLTRDLPENLLDAWERIRETAITFGEQRIYASHKSIMFARKRCYFFVRPKKNVLEICLFLGRPLKHPLVRKSAPSSKVKMAHLIHLSHRDEVETPITDWLKEAYEVSETLSDPASKKRTTPKKKTRAKARK